MFIEKSKVSKGGECNKKENEKERKEGGTHERTKIRGERKWVDLKIEKTIHLVAQNY